MKCVHLGFEERNMTKNKKNVLYFVIKSGVLSELLDI